LVEADEGAAEDHERFVNVGASLVSRMVGRRKRASQAKVRPTTQRCLPSFSLVSTPRLAMRGWTERRQHEAVVPVRGAQADPEGRAPAVDHKMALRARFAAIRRVRAGFGTLLFAGTDALSRHARRQSMAPTCSSRSRSTRWRQDQGGTTIPLDHPMGPLSLANHVLGREAVSQAIESSKSFSGVGRVVK
jgi:hypothetical protein